MTGYKGDRYTGGYKFDNNGGIVFGEGEYALNQNFKFEGDWAPEYTKHGEGKMFYGTGNSYIGSWEDDKPNGFGKKKWANGDVYEGTWAKGKQHGEGTFTWANGWTYKGEFKNGKRNGEGTKRRPDGSLLYTGRWVNGDPERLEAPAVAGAAAAF
jgi:hypothetical protein